MHIAGSIPQHIARAYGIKTPAPKVAPVAPAPMANAPAALGAAPKDEVVLSTKITEMVAGRVAAPVEFSTPDLSAVPRRAVLSLYTRAADQVEAAVGIELGRSLDVSG